MIYAALRNSKTEVEANLILNTVTLLKDAKPGYDFEFNPEWFPAPWRKEERSNVNRRLGYFKHGK